MNNAWNCYLLAFKNIFNYKEGANRQELNWFLLFWFVLWVIIGFISFGIIATIAISGKNPLIFISTVFIIACIYHVIHIFPLVSLVKRRFNNIAQFKSKLFFSIWLTIFFIQIVFCNVMFFLVDSIKNINPIFILPIVFVGQICGFLVIGTIIFLMIREKPIA